MKTTPGYQAASIRSHPHCLHDLDSLLNLCLPLLASVCLYFCRNNLHSYHSRITPMVLPSPLSKYISQNTVFEEEGSPYSICPSLRFKMHLMLLKTLGIHIVHRPLQPRCKGLPDRVQSPLTQKQHHCGCVLQSTLGIFSENSKSI